MPNHHALQRTAAGPRGCTRHAPWPPSLSLARCAAYTMRILCTMLSSLTIVVLAGCARDQVSNLSRSGRTILPGGQSVASLNLLANNTASNRADRARAIFTLFARHIQPGCTAVEVRKALTDINWLGEAGIGGVWAVGGWIPVEMNDAFALSLFVDANGWSEWVIYMRLSCTTGRKEDEVVAFLRQHAMPEDELALSIASQRLSTQEALAFLKGGSSLAERPRLQEFALCFPNLSEHHGRKGRIERHGLKGIHVYEQE